MWQPCLSKFHVKVVCDSSVASDCTLQSDQQSNQSPFYTIESIAPFEREHGWTQLLAARKNHRKSIDFLVASIITQLASNQLFFPAIEFRFNPLCTHECSKTRKQSERVMCRWRYAVEATVGAAVEAEGLFKRRKSLLKLDAHCNGRLPAKVF